MAATFIVETGEGLINANAYITIAEADQIIENYGDSQDWSSAEDEEKENAIREASRYVDLRYKFQGFKSNWDQALEFPRIEVYDFGGIQQDYNVVPEKLKQACAYLALKVIEGNILLDDLDGGTDATIQSQSSSIGPISESITYRDGAPPNKSYQIANKLLEQYTAFRGGASEILRG